MHRYRQNASIRCFSYNTNDVKVQYVTVYGLDFCVKFQINQTSSLSPYINYTSIMRLTVLSFLRITKTTEAA